MSRRVSLSVSLSLMKTGMLLLLLEEGVLHPRRQRFQLKKKMLWFFFFVELEVAAQICFLGELNGIFFRDAHCLLRWVFLWSSLLQLYCLNGLD
jgi:hypothetical protein